MMARGAGGGYEYRFCPHCGTLMDLPSAGRTLHCPLCRAERVLDPGESVWRPAPALGERVLDAGESV